MTERVPETVQLRMIEINVAGCLTFADVNHFLSLEEDPPSAVHKCCDIFVEEDQGEKFYFFFVMSNSIKRFLKVQPNGLVGSCFSGLTL